MRTTVVKLPTLVSLTVVTESRLSVSHAVLALLYRSIQFAVFGLCCYVVVGIVSVRIAFAACTFMALNFLTRKALLQFYLSSVVLNEVRSHVLIFAFLCVSMLL